ncbi:universal stress protein [Sedimentitalea nanhaiensis]|uniref:Nucleotide-binding universal stress protein, UspA family n=1 Tax=Sedimentitalea nanhaiensis TaxID=999627 RepID=A0A1I7BDZ5_9RHOB|nr:universal stress protein [Sedimentitalea nanhaiensis]SFT85312.1 Nucleotide-binding universal stress protein, UspA family [Sedimentitalea nanhaiensis]
MIRKILVPVRGDGKGDNVLAHAAAMAHRNNSHLVITHCRARPEDLLPFGVPIPAMFRKQMVKQAEELANLEEASLKDELKALASELNLVLSDVPNGSDKATASWVEETGKQVDVIRRHGRLADVIAVAQPDVDRNLGANTLKAALFRTGRPVMMVPNKIAPPNSLGAHVSIAWNGSLESSRAVTMTLPILHSADRVTILSSGGEPKSATAEDLQGYLAAHGVTARIHRFTGSGNVGKTLLSSSLDVGADTLIMGAYGDSHEKETIFGGNTQHIVDKAKMPVILVH